MSEATYIDDVVEVAEHLAFVHAVELELDWLTRFASGSDEETRQGAALALLGARRVRDRAMRRLLNVHGWDARPWYVRARSEGVPTLASQIAEKIAAGVLSPLGLVAQGGRA